jgi:hypothetical protein
MTFFLKDFDPAAQPPRRGPDTRPSRFLEGWGAAASRMMRDTNASFQRQREVVAEQDGAALAAARRLGVNGLRPLIDERNRKAAEMGMPSQMVDAQTAEEMAAALGPNGSKAILDLARQAAEREPERWRDIDLTDEGIQARVSERRRAEDQDEADSLAMMTPGERAAAELLGGMVGAIADVRQIPFMLVSGGGSLLSMMGRAALANAAAEAVTLPSMYDTAAELNKPDPNPLQQMAFGALGGAAFTGIFEGLPMAARRGLAYYRDRQTITPVEGVDPVHQSAAIQAAEGALANGEDPVFAADAILSRPEAVQVVPPEGVPVVTTEPLIPPKPTQIIPENIPDDAALAQQAVDVLRATDSRVKRPLSDWIKSSPKRGEDFRIDPAGPLGQELKARGVTSRTYPGLFKKGGRGDLEDLVASEMEETFPGISAAAGVDAGYLDARGLAEVLIRDAQGDASWLYSRADVMAAEKAAFDMENPNRTAVQDYQEGLRAPDGFFVDKMAYDFAGGDVEGSIARDFDRWSQERGFDTILTPGERQEILAQLSKDGGDAEYLVERALERERDYVDGPENPAADQFARMGQGGGEPPWPDPREASGGAAGAGRGQPAFERTPAGDQSVIPGIDPITERQRLEAGQQQRLGGAPRGPDSEIGGLFDPADKVRADLFDDPGGPKARPAQDAMREAMRDTVEADDFVVDLGTGPRSARSLLDEMDGDDEFAAVLDACGKRRTE